MNTQKRWPTMEEKDWNVVVEEVGEVARLFCERELHPDAWPDEDFKMELWLELVQVGAMVAAWIDALDARDVEDNK